jgi:hypothetical protein
MNQQLLLEMRATNDLFDMENALILVYACVDISFVGSEL